MPEESLRMSLHVGARCLESVDAGVSWSARPCEPIAQPPGHHGVLRRPLPFPSEEATFVSASPSGAVLAIRGSGNQELWAHLPTIGRWQRFRVGITLAMFTTWQETGWPDEGSFDEGALSADGRCVLSWSCADLSGGEGADALLLRGTVGGLFWRHTRKHLPPPGLTMTPGGLLIVVDDHYALRPADFLRSADGGATWSRRPIVLAGTPTESIATHSQDWFKSGQHSVGLPQFVDERRGFVAFYESESVERSERHQVKAITVLMTNDCGGAWFVVGRWERDELGTGGNLTKSLAFVVETGQ